MKILHLMWDEKFKKPIASFYDKFFNNGEHEICYVNKKGQETLIEKELTINQKEIYLSHKLFDFIKYISLFSEYDYVVIHSLIKVDIVTKGAFVLTPKRCKRIIWIEWGADLYNWRLEGKSLKVKLKNWLNYNLRNNVGIFVGIFPPDCDCFRSDFPNTKAKVFYAPYCGSKIVEEYFEYNPNSRLSNTKANGETVYIQVGHNALPTLNHIRVLKRLEKYKDEDIMLFLPLSYGEKMYADKVQAYAEEHFPQKTLILREMMPTKDYFELLSRIDIAIFDTQRQCGLGNINRMAFRNVKLYMSRTGIMYKHFTEYGVPVQDVEQIEVQDFEAFSAIVNIMDRDKFKNYVESLSNMDWKVKQWVAIYDSLRI